MQRRCFVSLRQWDIGLDIHHPSRQGKKDSIMARYTSSDNTCPQPSDSELRMFPCVDRRGMAADCLLTPAYTVDAVHPYAHIFHHFNREHEHHNATETRFIPPTTQDLAYRRPNDAIPASLSHFFFYAENTSRSDQIGIMAPPFMAAAIRVGDPATV